MPASVADWKAGSDGSAVNEANGELMRALSNACSRKWVVMSSEEDEENELAVVIGVCSGTGSAFAEGPAKHVIAVAMTVMRFLICFVIVG